MENTEKPERADSAPWIMTLGSLLPLWLLAIAVTAEGFPRPPISGEVGFVLFGASIVASIVLIRLGWSSIELLLYSLFPLVLLGTFDEISTAYKTPFIILCTVILAAGLVVYQYLRSSRLVRCLVLLAFLTVTWVAADHAASSFWAMTRDLGYGNCFPDAPGCAPLTGRGTPWWILFFSF